MFYERLGFVRTYQFPPEGEPGFVTLERGDSSIGIGASVVAAPEDQPWGERVAQTRDPAGNLVYAGMAAREA